MDNMKSSTQYTMRGGPKGVLPESELDEAESVGGIDAILAKHPKAVEIFKQGGDMDYDLESDLWDYYFNQGDIKNYDADASEYLGQQLADHLGIDESALQAYLGDKKYGEKGMDALRKAGREHAGKEKMQSIRAKFSDKEEDLDEEVDLGQYDAVKSTHKGETTPEQEKSFREKLQQYAKELEQRQKEQGVAEGSEQTVNLDNLDKLINRTDYSLARKGDPARYHDVEVDKRTKIIYWVTQETTTKQSQEFAIRLANILKNNGFNGWTVKVVRRDFYNGKRSPWKVAIVEQGVAEDLDANQKRVGQLGPTEKVGKKGAVGKLVGANENFISMAPQAVAEGQDDLDAILRIIRK